VQDLDHLGVDVEGGDVGSGRQECARERAGSRADLDDPLTGPADGQPRDARCCSAIDQEMLAEPLLRPETELSEQRARRKRGALLANRYRLI
jgi:hypothetical protein